jgi:hypothetical protein
MKDLYKNVLKIYKNVQKNGLKGEIGLLIFMFSFVIIVLSVKIPSYWNFVLFISWILLCILNSKIQSRNEKNGGDEKKSGR